MTDGFFRKIGLSGRSVFTMLTGIGCSATAVLTARGLEDETMRKKTVILTPFISCSARLPIYTTIASAYFAKGKILLVFALYILGAAVSVIAAAIMEKCTKRLKSGRLSFIMEMPPYRFPTVERLAQIIVHNCKVFVVKVGTVIFAFNVIVWLLSNFSLVGGFTDKPELSLLATFSGFIAPLFAPLGFGNWRAVTALTGGFVAKEMVVSIMESLGGIQAIFTSAYPSVSAAAFAVYTLLYLPCVATFGAEIKEVGWKWTAFGLILQTSVAYLCALAVRLVGIALVANAGLTVGVAVAVLPSASLRQTRFALHGENGFARGAKAAAAGDAARKTGRKARQRLDYPRFYRIIRSTKAKFTEGYAKWKTKTAFRSKTLPLKRLKNRFRDWRKLS